MASTVKIIDKQSNELLFECCLSEIERANAYATDMDKLGIEVIIDIPGLPQSFINSLAPDTQTIN